MRSTYGLAFGLAAVAASLALAAPARANLLISVDKSNQQMTVTVDGDPRYVWPVATGVERHDTPAGQFKPFRMEKDHFSREWDDAPMPYSIFFTQDGHAIHGTNHKISGQPASHGCVRLSVKHAAQLWALVKEQKMANTRVELIGEIPTKNELMAKRSEPDADDDRAARDSRTDRARIMSDEDDDDARSASPRAGRGLSTYREGGRTYYYRSGPREVQRIYRRVYRYYRYGGFPF
jgi:hypothetical protein